MIKKLRYVIGKNLATAQWINRRHLKKVCQELKGKVLDLGSGTGEYSLAIAQNQDTEVYALDANQALCDALQKEVKEKQLKNLKVVHTDAHTLPFEDNYFDACFCNAVLEHVKDDVGILKEIHRVMKKEAKLVISIPFLQEIHADPDDYRRYTPFGFRLVLRNHGFEILNTFADHGAMNAIEYLLLGTFVWRLRLGFKKNFPFGYLYIITLIALFGIVKILNWLFFFLRKKDDHFMTQITITAKKD